MTTSRRCGGWRRMDLSFPFLFCFHLSAFIFFSDRLKSFFTVSKFSGGFFSQRRHSIIRAKISSRRVLYVQNVSKQQIFSFFNFTPFHLLSLLLPLSLMAGPFRLPQTASL